jgi:hypothetical protein
MFSHKTSQFFSDGIAKRAIWQRASTLRSCLVPPEIAQPNFQRRQYAYSLDDVADVLVQEVVDAGALLLDTTPYKP